MTSVQEIERAIDALTAEQVAELHLWLDQRHAQLVDAQLVADLESGRFDDRIGLALEDHQAGRSRLL